MSSNTRDRLIESTRELLWDRGYAAMSPRAILAASGAGQGSMYHHFGGKEELALAAIERAAERMKEQVRAELSINGTAVDRISNYLHRERDALKGCPFGRLTQDAEVIASTPLRAPVAEMFEWLRQQLADVIAEGQQRREFPTRIEAAKAAAMIIATLQGGYVLARASQDRTAFQGAISGAIELLKLLELAD